MRARAALLLVGASAIVGGLLASCNDDGRTLRDPRPDQVGSVSTIAPTTTTDFVDTLPAFDDTADDLAPFETVTIESRPGIDVAPQVFAPFVDGGEFDPRHTCDGSNVSPPLGWSAAPTGTQEIAITLVDVAAPDAPLWVITAIDPFAVELAEGSVPEFAILGTNADGVTGYSGPCPGQGLTSTYVLTVHFLDQVTELSDGSAAADLQAFVKGASFESASITGTYSQGRV